MIGFLRLLVSYQTYIFITNTQYVNLLYIFVLSAKLCEQCGDSTKRKPQRNMTIPMLLLQLRSQIEIGGTELDEAFDCAGVVLGVFQQVRTVY